MQIDINGSVSYFLEVDLDYPESLHTLHSQYPLAPDKYTVNYSDLSEYSKKVLSMCTDKYSIKHNFEESKLIPTLHGRKKYKVHIRNLIYYLL